MENKAVIFCLLIIVALVLFVYAFVATQLMINGFMAIFDPKTYGLNVIRGVRYGKL